MTSKKKLEKRIRKLEKKVKALQEDQYQSWENFPPGRPFYTHHVSPTLVPNITGN